MWFLHNELCFFIAFAYAKSTSCENLRKKDKKVLTYGERCGIINKSPIEGHENEGLLIRNIESVFQKKLKVFQKSVDKPPTVCYNKQAV